MKTIFFVGNAHLDPVWMWRWQEGSAEAKATVRSALDRMKEYPEFKFVCSSASVYRWVEEFDPAMFEEIKQRVREGRWIVVGGWFVQPDCNLPSGEGFARQSLYSQRYFRETLGVTAKVGYNVDSFGHNGMLPQILKKSGMDSYIFMRPGEHEKAMPAGAFRWRSPDGSEVTAFRIHEFYAQNFGTSEELETHLSHLEQAFAPLDCAMLFYGVGNHGGGPTKRNIELILQNRAEHPERESVFSDITDCFAELQKRPERLPLHTDDLQHHASGCYSAVSDVKTAIRTAENALLSAEVCNMMAARLVQKPFVTSALAEAWQNVLFCHFHDIAGGCAIQSAYADALDMLSESRSIAERLKNNALQTVSWAIDTSDASRGLPIVLWNSNPFDVEEVVQINREVDGEITDGDGHPIQTQHVHSQTSACYARKDTIFSAKVPAMGYVTYYQRSEASTGVTASAVHADGLRLENECLCVEFEEHSGYLRSVRRKSDDLELLNGHGAIPIVIDEYEHDTWSHAMNFFTKRIGTFTDATVQVVENGPVRATVKVTSRYGHSVLKQYFSLCAGGDQLEVRAEVDWQEQHKMLKLAYETALRGDPKAYYEIPFGVIERPADGEEEPGYRWVAVADDDRGYALLNSDKYSFSVEGATLLLTVVRSPLYADHGRGRDEECVFTDQGIHRFSYAFRTVQPGDWGSLIRPARQLNTPVTVIMENNHSGRLADAFRGLHCSADNVQISALKRSEDGNGTVIRLYETDGKQTACTVDGALLPQPLRTNMTPYSVNTYVLIDGETEWKEVLLTEFEAAEP